MVILPVLSTHNDLVISRVSYKPTGGLEPPVFFAEQAWRKLKFAARRTGNFFGGIDAHSWLPVALLQGY